jgi:bifunctional DNase/RNase
MQLVECEVMRLGLDRSNNSYVVILREKEGERLLPIWIGQAEAESIVIEMSKLRRERPLTHDLCKSLITGMGGMLHRIEITKVENRTYYAELHIRLGDRTVQIDARPSDSIAIALRFSAPIFADEDLLTSLTFDDSSPDAESIPPTPEPEQSEEMTASELQKYLENLRPEDLGKFNI